jgi:hypothetical protein
MKAYQKLLEREQIVTLSSSSHTVIGDADFVNKGLRLEHEQYVNFLSALELH